MITYLRSRLQRYMCRVDLDRYLLSDGHAPSPRPTDDPIETLLLLLMSNGLFDAADRVLLRTGDDGNGIQTLVHAHVTLQESTWPWFEADRYEADEHGRTWIEYETMPGHVYPMVRRRVMRWAGIVGQMTSGTVLVLLRGREWRIGVDVSRADRIEFEFPFPPGEDALELAPRRG